MPAVGAARTQASNHTCKSTTSGQARTCDTSRTDKNTQHTYTYTSHGDAPTSTPGHPTTIQLYLALHEMQHAERANLLGHYTAPLLLAQQHSPTHVCILYDAIARRSSCATGNSNHRQLCNQRVQQLVLPTWQPDTWCRVGSSQHPTLNTKLYASITTRRLSTACITAQHITRWDVPARCICSVAGVATCRSSNCYVCKLQAAVRCHVGRWHACGCALPRAKHMYSMRTGAGEHLC
jgi:hypothetical protein